MIHVTSLNDGVELFKALGSDVRIQILNILLENDHMSMKDLAAKLNLSNGALTSHIKKLEEVGLISTTKEADVHGNSKICSVIQDKILIEIDQPVDYAKTFSASLKVGQFSRCKIIPTCGLATSSSIIGSEDDPRYFAHPDRFQADILWFTEGFVEYALPNLIPANNRITQISISFEISSEAPGVNNNWPSDISFFINKTKVGTWTSPGDFGGDVHGIFTPDWWPPNWNQYGLLKLLVINRHGTFIDGLKISDVTTMDLALTSLSEINFRIATESMNGHSGGVTLFGKSFGNYGQDIRVSVNYAPILQQTTQS